MPQTLDDAVSRFGEAVRGKGPDPMLFAAKSADGQQWEKLKSLPNVFYTGYPPNLDSVQDVCLKLYAVYL